MCELHRLVRLKKLVRIQCHLRAFWPGGCSHKFSCPDIVNEAGAAP